MPYLTSLDVTGVPSSQRSPGRSVYVQVRPPSVVRPRLVVRSGTNRAPAAPGAAANVTSWRVYSRIAFHTAGEYDRAGSRLSTPPVTSRSVPPGWSDASRTPAVPASIPGTESGSGGPAGARQ